MRKLLPWQLEAFGYSLKERHPALIMDPRLGKCLVVIRRCKLYKPRDLNVGLRVLIVAPSSALSGWVTELEKENEKDFMLLLGTREERSATLETPRRWTITNKESFLVIPQIAKMKWDAVVIDESTFIKNPKAKVTKFYLNNFRYVTHRWILTGTPIPNSKMEWCCQMIYLDGIFLGHYDYWRFRASECRVFGFNWQPTYEASKKINELVNNRCFIRTKKDVGIFDARETITRIVELPTEVRKKYNKAEDEFDLDGRWVMYKVQVYSYLRQLANGIENGSLIWKGKFDELVYVCNEFVFGQAVIWFAFNKEIEHAKGIIDSSESLTGEDKLEIRHEVINRFREGKFKFLLMQIAIGKMGLDLSCADTAIYFSKSNEPEACFQSKERIFNLNKKRILLYINIVTRDTVDQDNYETIDDKMLIGRLGMHSALVKKMKARRKS